MILISQFSQGAKNKKIRSSRFNKQVINNSNSLIMIGMMKMKKLRLHI